MFCTLFRPILNSFKLLEIYFFQHYILRMTTICKPTNLRPVAEAFTITRMTVLKSCVKVWLKILLSSFIKFLKGSRFIILTVTNENGKPFTLDSLRGRPLLINFWASWCAPCIAEMPSLQKAAEQLHPDGIDVLLISLDRGGVKKALPVLRAHGVTTPRLGFDPKAALSREMGVSGLPTSFLLSADHQNCVIYVGPREWHEDPLLSNIREFVTITSSSSA